MTEIENPIRATEARKILGIGASAFSAIKREMGLKGRKFVFLSKIQRWRRDHPDFREQDVYHRPGCACKDCVAKRANPNRRGRSNQLVSA